MTNRGMIKWAPFNSIINNKAVIKEINNTKSKIIKPILLEEELLNIENTIITAKELGLSVTITYFYAGKLKDLTGYITKLNQIKKEITINHQVISFIQITKIKIDT